MRAVWFRPACPRTQIYVAGANGENVNFYQLAGIVSTRLRVSGAVLIPDMNPGASSRTPVFLPAGVRALTMNKFTCPRLPDTAQSTPGSSAHRSSGARGS